MAIRTVVAVGSVLRCTWLRRTGVCFALWLHEVVLCCRPVTEAVFQRMAAILKSAPLCVCVCVCVRVCVTVCVCERACVCVCV